MNSRFFAGEIAKENLGGDVMSNKQWLCAAVASIAIGCVAEKPGKPGEVKPVGDGSGDGSSDHGSGPSSEQPPPAACSISAAPGTVERQLEIAGGAHVV